MTKFITVFIRTTWVIKPYSSGDSPLAQGSWPPENIVTRVMSRRDALALEAAKEVAEEFRMRLEVRDLATPRGWFSALINRVKVTPMVIVDDLRVEEITSKDDLLRLMKKV
jgi:hypothetical protein